MKPEKKSSYGKYEPLRGKKVTIGGALPAKPQSSATAPRPDRKTHNYPMDSDEAFKKRLKRYEAQRAAETAALDGADALPLAEAVPA